MTYHADVDDAALVAGAIAGDREAFGELYDRYGGRIHDFLCSVLRDRDEAADVLHDTFLVAGARLHQLRDPAKVRPWLYAIARHEALRRIKQRSRNDALGDTEVIAPGPGPAEVAAQGELVELVAAAAEGLSLRDRTLLDLHLRQGLDGQELGDAMGVSAGHAYVLLSRLRDQVERSLGALLVTRLGRDGCPGLEAVLDGWDGRFSPLMRKRVARHVDGCEACGDVRSRAVSPLALLAAVPPVALPGGLRHRVLGDVSLVSHTGRPWPAHRGGFPPTDEPRRRRVGLGAAAAVVVLVLALSGGDRPEPGRAVTTDGATTSTSTSAPDAPGSSTSTSLTADPTTGTGATAGGAADTTRGSGGSLRSTTSTTRRPGTGTGTEALPGSETTTTTATDRVPGTTSSTTTVTRPPVTVDPRPGMTSTTLPVIVTPPPVRTTTTLGLANRTTTTRGSGPAG